MQRESYFPEMEHSFVTERSRTHRRQNAQFTACRRENLPLVIITPRRRFASVEIDMWPTDKNFDSATEQQMAAICAEHTHRANIAVCTIQCIAAGIPRESSESLARKLFDAAVAAMPNLPPVIPGLTMR
jgi:hypothetical protein